MVEKGLNRQMDVEWIQLIQEARDMGISKEEVRLFFQKHVAVGQILLENVSNEEIIE